METENLKTIILSLLEEKKADNIAVIDLANTTSLAKFMIFANGRSTKNIAAIADYVTLELKQRGYPRTHIEGLNNSTWVLIDAQDVVVHLFHPEARDYYKLEQLWQPK